MFLYNQVSFNSIIVRHLFDKFFPLSPHRFAERKSRGRRLAIGWQATAPTCQPIADRLPRDFCLSKTQWIIGFNAGLLG